MTLAPLDQYNPLINFMGGKGTKIHHPDNALAGGANGAVVVAQLHEYRFGGLNVLHTDNCNGNRVRAGLPPNSA
jgi:hypothetical protein